MIGLLLRFGNAEKPGGNVHTNEPPPLAVSVVVLIEALKFCEHKVFVPTIFAVGLAITETFATALLVQPCALVTITV